MNIVFFGSSQFAVPSLKALLTTAHKVSCVVTQPDRQKGRGLSLTCTAIKAMALGQNISIYQPRQANTPETIELLGKFNPDLFVVISYGQILSQEVLNIPKIFSINVHASSLPKYRGAAPINWAIINGEKATGITVIKMIKEMDAGPIILQEKVNINNNDNSVALEDRLSNLGAKLLLNTIDAIENNSYKLVPQNEDEVSFAPKLKKADGLIDWNKPSQDIYNLTRGCLTWPGAFTYYNGKLLKIYKTKCNSTLGLQYPRAPVPQGSSTPGEIIGISKEGIVVATGTDSLIIEELQMEGKRRMKVEEFIAGHKICAGEILGKK